MTRGQGVVAVAALHVGRDCGRYVACPVAHEVEAEGVAVVHDAVEVLVGDDVFPRVHPGGLAHPHLVEKGGR